jgi:hypothetical protein
MLLLGCLDESQENLHAQSSMPSHVTYVEIKEQVDKRIRDNRRINTDEAASGLSTMK